MAMVPPVALIAAASLAIANKLFDIMQTVSFMMFIEEEGIQVRGFGIMSLIREKLVDDVEAQLEEMKTHTQNLENFVDSWGWIAPYMQPTYSRYVQSTWDQIDAWEAWLISVRAEEPKYGIRIVSSPNYATIFVDTVDINKLTPQSLLDLSVGSHQIRLEYISSRRGDLEFTGTVEVEKDVIKEYRWILDEV
jgi:hypothetical protein